MKANNDAKLREALELCDRIFQDRTIVCDCDIVDEARTVVRDALAAPRRECDRFDDFTKSDALHEAFVRYCNECDCPMGCIHRKDARFLLDTQCGSILKCFARFVLSTASEESEASDDHAV